MPPSDCFPEAPMERSTVIAMWPCSNVSPFPGDECCCLANGDRAISPSRGLRDTTSDITAFPIELLTEVFSYLVWTHPLESDLVSASHVCRYWRIAALDDAKLWTHVSATSVSKARTFFERSRKVPIEVRINDPGDADGVMDVLRAHSARLRSLRITTAHASVAAFYTAQLSQLKAPMLEVLHLEGPDGTSASPDSYSLQGMPHLQPECGPQPMDMPRLRSLRLCPYGIPWHASVYRRLTVLDVRAPCMHPPSMKRFLEILFQCPDLEELRMGTSALCDDSVYQTDAEWMVPLPRLSILHLDGPSPTQTAQFLSHLSLSARTRYTLSTSADAAVLSSYPGLSPRRDQHPGLAGFRNVQLRQTGLGSIELLCSHIATEEPALTLNVRLDDISAVLRSLVGGAVDMKDVETLTVALYAATEVTFADWYSGLRGLSSLRSLRLAGLTNNSIRAALSALRTPLVLSPGSTARIDGPGPSDGTGSRKATGVFCPKMEELVLSEVEVPCRISTDMIWFCDERRRLGHSVKRIEAGSDMLSTRCATVLRAQGVVLL